MFAPSWRSHIRHGMCFFQDGVLVCMPNERPTRAVAMQRLFPFRREIPLEGAETLPGLAYLRRTPMDVVQA